MSEFNSFVGIVSGVLENSRVIEVVEGAEHVTLEFSAALKPPRKGKRVSVAFDREKRRRYRWTDGVLVGFSVLS